MSHQAVIGCGCCVVPFCGHPAFCLRNGPGFYPGVSGWQNDGLRSFLAQLAVKAMQKNGGVRVSDMHG
eukprot:1573857-Amphidinium_carterae.1